MNGKKNKNYVFSKEIKDATENTASIYLDNLQKMTDGYLERERNDLSSIRERLILTLGEADIFDYDGSVLFDHNTYRKYDKKTCPDTVNPYLWQANISNDIAGVVQLSDDFYIVTGVDISILGFARTDNGWIIQDAGNYPDTAFLALRMVETALGEDIKNNIKAIIISHSHVDHYGGIAGLIDESQIGQISRGKVLVIAPGNYEQSLIDDNLYAGVIMARRLQYQGGFLIEPGAHGIIGCGLNAPLRMGNHVSFMMPNLFVENDKTINIDGVDVDFRLTPDTETRSHMCTYYHKHEVLFLGDNSMGTLHNTYTMRGARVRDANFWGNVFYKLEVEYGKTMKAVYQGHGLAHVKQNEQDSGLSDFLLNNAAAYKYTSDQALLLANQGYSINDIGHMDIPDDIGKIWYVRPHYGHYSFNARGAYMRYLGFYDGNPVNLLPLKKQEAARKLVEYIGDEEIVLEKAVKDFQNGEYQWVATITNYLVYLNPENTRARYLCADALEQLGYQAESGLWRNAYLSGAYELRTPKEDRKKARAYMDNESIIPYVSVDLILDYLGINFDGQKAIKENLRFVLQVESDEAEKPEYHRVQIYKGTVFHIKISNKEITDKDDLIKVDKKELYRLASGKDVERNDLLGDISKNIVDTSVYYNANLIEPLTV